MSVEPEPSPARRLLSAEAPPAWTASALAGVRHGFFGRAGGVSTGIYASLNAGPGSNDDPRAVAKNRARIAAAFAAAPEMLVSLHQVHSAAALYIDAPFPGQRPQADALVTTRPGLVLSVLSADCAPVLFADVEARVIGAAHAGWKGALGGVLEATINLMQQHGAAPARIAAAIGPCIHQASYEVGPEFEARFLDANAAHARFFVPGAADRRWFDLPGFCAARLAALGIGQVDVLALDTCAEAEALFSHRRSARESAGDYGRNCAAIALATP